MTNTKSLGDLAAELIGISSTVSILRPLIKPNPDALNCPGYPTEQTIEAAFFAISRAIDRIADDLNDLDAK